ncbi:uncharacterized protein L969DRAFT_100022 [Mixia osmundae IAM 14324]|uniref:C2 domain-containing protein n=1 Tax=Mixia osmundae (strain CBS 9802 / IAM 14324 / JCM 22182 / KY 12970) TaxID=764103 RepID=G7DZL5_MIXOS|nr:uncharacterized protein L969DRAFT_100022 [Mixia osmundae IAM 14324]KEI37188.1 hypothetical protein L969DRAFT_100022 [Mixia osmundae IAM 14324]GAA96025.1 hypothetical protein E5Q_02685 [Mixia osmundae IAM 14324]
MPRNSHPITAGLLGLRPTSNVDSSTPRGGRDRRHSFDSLADSTSSGWEQIDFRAKDSHEEPKNPETGTGAVNLNNAAFPPADINSFHDEAMYQVVVAIIICSGTSAALTHFGWNIAWLLLAVGLTCYSIRRRVESLRDDYTSDVERRHAKMATSHGAPSESVEWMNGLIRAAWPLINSELFVALIDLLEDTMKAKAPAFVHSVRIEDFDLGLNPPRLLGMRMLSENEDVGFKDRAVIPDEGDFCTIEVDYSYRRLPTAHHKKHKTPNSHLLVFMGISLGKIARYELPSLVEISGVVGRARVRVQLISDPPFLRHCTLTLPSRPRIDIRVRPSRSLKLDLMNIPGISSYILSSINIVAENFVSPRSYTLDVSKIIMGSDIPLKTEHCGVIFLGLLSASELGVHHETHHLDTFIEVILSGKVIYKTRIIRQCKMPCWQESVFVKVLPSHLSDNDAIRITISHADRLTDSDIIGFLDVKLQELVDNPSVVSERREPIRAVRRATAFAGQMRYTVGYYPLAKVLTADEDRALGLELPVGSRRVPFLDRASRESETRSGLYATRMREMLDSTIPPSPDKKTGLISVHIHQVANIETPTHKPAGKLSTDRTDASPSTYCVIFCNGEQYHETRVQKAFSPYVNHGEEFFCKDWTDTRLDLAVFEKNENDPQDTLVGAVTLNLNEVISRRSQVSHWYPLTRGKGVGRIRISLLFKALDMALPDQLQGWDVGTLEISHMRARGIDRTFVGVATASVGTYSYATAGEAGAEPFEGDTNFDLDTYAANWAHRTPMRVPMFDRRREPCVIQFKETRHLQQAVYGQATIWPQKLVDQGYVRLTLPIYGHNLARHATCAEDEPGVVPCKWVDPDAKVSKSRQRREKLYEAAHQLTVQMSDRVSEMKRRQTLSEEHVKGYLDVTLHFVPGIGQVHRSLTEVPFPLVERAIRLYGALDDSEPAEKGNSGVKFRDTPTRPLHNPRSSSSSPKQGRSAENSIPNSRRSSRISLTGDEWKSEDEVAVRDDEVAVVRPSKQASTPTKTLKWVKKHMKRKSASEKKSPAKPILHPVESAHTDSTRTDSTLASSATENTIESASDLVSPRPSTSLTTQPLDQAVPSGFHDRDHKDSFDLRDSSVASSDGSPHPPGDLRRLPPVGPLSGG